MDPGRKREDKDISRELLRVLGKRQEEGQDLEIGWMMFTSARAQTEVHLLCQGLHHQKEQDYSFELV